MLQIVYYDQQCLNDGSKISYHSFTTLADEEINWKLSETYLKSKVDLDSVSHHPGEKEMYALPLYTVFCPTLDSCVIELII